ncbi:hypothetical protein [Bifidobacterium choloepi]|uniref:PEGA domain-containing protein n=1 Tax=Bifidobacterium choloepi TaxID=2614131 RepID=A0A6I5N1I0_9BIFI|nr:hypothetical protein [Bifidobacterium choloepi]NEG69489.1 hypothetical protein [Bifidobacterium choloepi]
MELSIAWIGPRGIVVHINDGGIFHTKQPWQIYVNDILVRTTNTVETYVDGFLPGRTVSLAVQHEDFSSYQDTTVTLPAERATYRTAIAA